MKLHRRQHEIRLELTPLIDVVFLLLVFFVFALVLMVRADTLDLQLPEVGSGEPARAGQEIRVTLSADGTVYVAGEPVDASDAGDAVRSRLEEFPGTPVVLSADARARAGVLIEIADVLVSAGVTEFSVLGSPIAGGASRDGPVSGVGEPAPANTPPPGDE